MKEHEASRTLVKSPPELWAECSDAAALARHLGAFGELKITRLEPETAVAWEGERASGTVRIEPSGWGTRVTLTAVQAVPETATPELGSAEAEGAAEPNDRVPDEGGSAPEDQVTDEVGAEPKDLAGPEVEAEVQDPPAPSDPPRRSVMARIRAFFKRMRAPTDQDVALTRDPEAEAPAPDRDPGQATPEPEAVAPDPPPVEPERPPVETGRPPTETGRPPTETGRLPTEPEPTPLALESSPVDAQAVLAAALDSLGQAHHRPFSRA